ncbi:MAG: HAMP domain-containing sensor histidine kinase [Nitriliruptoraceae bacterium]
MGTVTAPSDFDGIRRIDRVVIAYMLVAVVWIALGGIVATGISAFPQAPEFAINLVWGLGFALVTGLVLRALLRRNARRLAAAAEAEHRAAERLREVARIRASFLRGISHELRTPLTNIVGYGQTLNDHLHRLDRATAEQCTERLVANARRLEHLVLDLLDLDRLTRTDEQVTHEPVRVDWLVRDIVAELPCDHHAVHVKADPSVTHLDVDKTGRIIEELVRNALRHTPAGTNIWVRAEARARNLRLTVEDDGPGIDMALADEIFEPFSQGVAAGALPSPGLGIGLALIRRYASMQGGNVTVDTHRQRGAKFVVTLPRQAPLTDPRLTVGITEASSQVAPT